MTRDSSEDAGPAEDDLAAGSEPERAASDESPAAEDQEAEEGGFVEGADKVRSQPREVGTRQLLTYVIIALLGLTFLLHYISLAWLIDPEKEQTVAALQKVFDMWLPVIAGLAGSAATYFYTRGGH